MLFKDMPTFHVPQDQPNGGAVTGGGSGSSAASITPFTSISAAKAASSATVGVNNLIFIIGAINTGALNTYQLLIGTPTQSSPYQFSPNDNSSLYYSLVS